MNLLAKLKGGRGSYEIDMTHGPLLGKIVRFAIPLAISGILQLLFNAADIIVVGQFVGPQALAAVGSTSALINLIVNLFIGLSVGANVLVAQYYGASDTKALRETVHTSVLASLIFGCIVLVIGITLAAPMLELMGTPEEVLDQACLYMRIYFIGMPASMLYNFGAAILRAVGDTQRPLYFLFIAGIVNVLLNLFCVIVLHMGVEGVAIPTVISQCVSAGLVLLCLVKAHAPYHVDLHALRFKKDKLLGMVKIGLPAGIQGCSFSISNVLIQSSINSFGALAMAGNTAASNIEGFVSTAHGRLLPGSPELYRPERGRGPDKTGQPYFALVRCAGAGRGVGAGFGRLFAGQPAAWNLFLRPGSYRLWHEAHGHLLRAPVRGRPDGRDGGHAAGHGLFLCAHGHHHRLCVRFPGDMDFHHFRAVAHFGIPLCLLSHHLGPGRPVRPDLLLLCAQAFDEKTTSCQGAGKVI